MNRTDLYLKDLDNQRTPILYKVDDHIHVARNKNNMFYNSIDEIKKMYEVMGIGHGIIVTTPEGLLKDSISCMEAVEICENDSMFSWMANLIPSGTDEDYKVLEKYKELNAVGVGEFVFNEFIDDYRIQKVFDCAEKLDLPILFHMSPTPGKSYGICDDAGLPRLEAALKKYPNLKIIGHSQTFWNEMTPYDTTDIDLRYTYFSGRIEKPGRLQYLLDNYPNLYCDLSANSGGFAIMRDPEYAIEFMNKYQDRLMYGTDCRNPFGIYPLGGYLDQLLISRTGDKTINFDVYEKICRLNAIRIFKLNMKGD